MSVSEYDCAVTNKNKVENISSLFGYLNPRPDELKLWDEKYEIIM